MDRPCPDAQDLWGNGVAGSVVGAHGSGGISDANALDGARLVGWHGLAFDGWDVGHPVCLAGPFCPAAQDASLGSALAHFMDQFDGARPISKGYHAGFHGYGNGGTGLDRVKTVGIAQLDQFSDMIQVVDAAVGAQRPRGFVLHTGGDLFPVFSVPGVRALDDAARAAAVVVGFLAGAPLTPSKMASPPILAAPSKRR
jgi:hypothetical protein